MIAEAKTDVEGTSPSVTVVVVSDYETGTEIGWRDLHDTLIALTRQDFDRPFEVLLCENCELAARIPPDVTAIVPSLRVIAAEARSSFALKNEGAMHATGDLVAFLDADAVPESGWLRHLVDALVNNPRAAVVSPRTLHREDGFVARATALLFRSHVDTGRSGQTRHVAAHAGLYRRAAVLSHPFHSTAGPFSLRLQSEAILNSGAELLFEPRARVTHIFDGWRSCPDIARNSGYGTVITRLLDPTQPFAWLTRLGRASIPLFVIGKTLDSVRDSVRCYRDYGLSAAQVPAVLLLAVLLHTLEVPGMLRAFARRQMADTAYR